MADNPQSKLFHGIYQNTLVIFHVAGEALDEMMVVSLSDGKLVKCSGAMEPYGFCAQKANATGFDELELNGLITRICQVDNELTPCGVFCGDNGVLKTDKVIGGVSADDVLYPHETSGGYITPASGSVAEDAVAVGIALEDLDSDGVVKFRCLR